MKKTVDSIKGYLGLCAKSGSIKYGSQLCLNEIRSGKIHLVILSDRASERTGRTFRHKCGHYKIECIELDDRFISEALGDRGNIVFGISDRGLAEEIIRLNTELRGCESE